MKNNRNVFLFAVTVIAGVTLLINCSPPSKIQQAPKGTVVFFEDFSDTMLDRSKWNAEVTGIHVNDELQAYVDSPLTIFTVSGADAEGAQNGALVLRPHASPNFKTTDGRTFNFISGRVNTKGKFDFTYGTAEARIKVTEGDGLWPAWWLLGNGNWPETGEIDIMEYVGEKDWVSAAVHGPGYSGETPFVNRQYFEKGNEATGWHVYAVDWTPNEMLFKYDGKLMFRVNRKMVEHYGKWAFDTPKYLILNYALGGAYPVKINGVKKPYYGMPESSLQLVKSSKAKMLVDWVRVTKREM
ncbi:glycoside hydrolase family 16 protein [Mucilaginibacter hurinus]|uniref:Glycoside hydrolase family 16 protein n=1 Tax=Mucilaginibacter hurinus TaxID=2201324 RepID=A0A367GQH0_9SPHI|nr:glycoside hydrolase family 16 protein [Mucilaginibacter hurinus]RCH55699.1 glycoside hydrolase family 16 protein [Mucilaginibacter hurinus]